MAQAQVNSKVSEEEGIQIIATDEKHKRKVNLCIGEQHYITISKSTKRCRG